MLPVYYRESHLMNHISDLKVHGHSSATFSNVRTSLVIHTLLFPCKYTHPVVSVQAYTPCCFGAGIHTLLFRYKYTHPFVSVQAYTPCCFGAGIHTLLFRCKYTHPVVSVQVYTPCRESNLLYR